VVSAPFLIAHTNTNIPDASVSYIHLHQQPPLLICCYHWSLLLLLLLLLLWWWWLEPFVVGRRVGR